MAGVPWNFSVRVVIGCPRTTGGTCAFLGYLYNGATVRFREELGAPKAFYVLQKTTEDSDICQVHFPRQR